MLTLPRTAGSPSCCVADVFKAPIGQGNPLGGTYCRHSCSDIAVQALTGCLNAGNVCAVGFALLSAANDRFRNQPACTGHHPRAAAGLCGARHAQAV